MDRLQYFQIAHNLNQSQSEVLHDAQLHFRGNLNSFSLINIGSEFPETGIPCGKTERNGLAKLEKIKCSNFATARRGELKKNLPKPEKKLQAWMIRTALSNQNILPIMNESFYFLTSELAFPKSTTNKRSRVVTDLLAIDEQENLVIIELKTSRLKSKLEEQLDNFFQIVERETEVFKQLVDLLSPYKWNGDIERVRKIAIWNDANQPLRKWEHNIEEFTFIEKENGYLIQKNR